MRILKWDGKLVEEICRYPAGAIDLKVMRDEDKNACPHCDKPIETIITVVEGSPYFKENAKPVETLVQLDK